MSTKKTTKKSTKKSTKKNKNFFNELYEQSKENINELSKNISEGAIIVGEKIKETANMAYDAGTHVVEETNEKIQQLSEVRSLKNNMNELGKRQKELTTLFGEKTLNQYLSQGNLHKRFLTTNVISEIVEEYQSNEKTLKKLAKQLKTLEN